MASTERQHLQIEAVRVALREFLDAFEILDLDRLMASWARDATVIHPFPQAPKRLSGWEEVRHGWLAVFEFMRTMLQGPPYLKLRPLDLDVRIVGSGAAVATFHLDLDQTIGRRTVVLEEEADTWKIVHLHASNVS